MALTRDELLQRKPNVKEVEIEGLGSVLIRPFNGDDIKKFQSVKEATDLAVVGVVIGLCDEKGERIFNDDESEKVAKALEFSHIEKITRAVLEHSGMIDPKLQRDG